MTLTFKNYQDLSAEKRLQRSNKIPQNWLIPTDILLGSTNLLKIPITCGILNDVECTITSEYDATALLEKIKSRTWSAEQVRVAFCKRAAISQQLTNCLTEIFFNEAIERACKLDREREENPSKALGPLHGLPISLKDSFQVLGHDTSTGLGCYVHEPAQENSAVAALLLDLGAVLYCKTNLPQSIMTGDSHNSMFGRTLNPHNTSLTAGGSTGEEGSLIALRGSLLGVGTDIGGSIRVPSVCNGIFGFRPSVGLVPHGGVRDLTVPETDGVYSTAGPMATSIRDCSLFLKAIMQADTWKYDSTVVSLPWMNLKVKERLRIGVAEDDGIYTPSPLVRQGLKNAIDLLRKSTEIEIIPITLPKVKDHTDTDHHKRTRGTVTEALGLLQKQGTTLQGFFDLNVRRAEAAKQYLKLFRSNNIDAIVMPPAPHTAVPLDTWTTATYTGLWKYLDYPAIVMPVDKVRKSDLADDPNNVKYGPEDGRLYSLYTGPELYKDAPLCVQVVGYRQAEEALLNTVTVLDPITNRKRLENGKIIGNGVMK